MKKNEKHVEWEKEMFLYINGKPHSFSLDNFIKSSQSKTNIIKKLIKARNESPDSYPADGKIAKRQNRIQFLLESLENRSGFYGNFLIFWHFYSWAIPLIAILLSIILIFTVSNNSQSNNSSEWFCSMVDGEKKCYREKDIDEMKDKYRN